jgi:hypothetical protein
MAECPSGCGMSVAPGKLTCLPCWREIPQHLQNEVLRTWRRYSRFTGLAQSPERRQARLDYQEARDAALGSIR